MRARHGQTPLSVWMLDIDHFKQINDTGGHSFGDAILKIVAGTIQKMFPSGSCVARYGGDEFAVIVKLAFAFAGRGRAVIANNIENELHLPLVQLGDERIQNRLPRKKTHLIRIVDPARVDSLRFGEGDLRRATRCSRPVCHCSRPWPVTAPHLSRWHCRRRRSAK